MSIAVKNIELYRGDTHILKLDLSADGQPFAVDAAQLAMSIRPADGSAAISPEISVSGHVVTLFFAPLLTHDLTWERAVYDLRAVYGGVVKTYLRGTVFIRPSVTQVKDLIGSGGTVHEATVAVDVSGQAVIIQSGGAAAQPQNGLSAYELAVNNGFSGSQSEWLASLIGEAGKQGERGDKGADGLPGRDGAAGADGQQGIAGKLQGRVA